MILTINNNEDTPCVIAPLGLRANNSKEERYAPDRYNNQEASMLEAPASDLSFFDTAVVLSHY